MANAMVKDFYTELVSFEIISKSLSPSTLDVEVFYTYFSGMYLF